jgi:Protein of unknown function (DUF3489)
MTTFTIDSENNITVFRSVNTKNNITGRSSATEAQDNPEADLFSSPAELNRLAEDWPGSRLVAIWNCLPAQKPVKRFTSRKAAVVRIWKAIHILAAERPQPSGVAPKKTRATKRGPIRKRTTARKGSKTNQVIELLKRSEGATLQDLMAATDWQAHSIRGFISGSLRKKMGLAIQSTTGADGIRTYSMKS